MAVTVFSFAQVLQKTDNLQVNQNFTPPVYANAAARDAAITNPSNGMIIYNIATGEMEVYSTASSAWTTTTATKFVDGTTAADAVFTTGNVGIGTTTPAGALDVVSTNSGFILPRVANTAAVTAPVDGMIIFDISSNCMKAYENGAWTDCLSKSLAVVSECGHIGFEGLYLVGEPTNNSNGFTVTFTNNGSSTETISFTTSDLVVSGTGQGTVTVASVSPTSATLTAGDSQIVRYQLSGSPTSGTLQGLWTNNSLTCTKSIDVGVLLEGEVYSASGRIWMDRNLGATRVATSRTDADSYGDLYQWGRTTDGHESRDSFYIIGPVASGSEGDTFIKTGNDWLSTQDDTRWGANRTANDPCPLGYRVPTEAEFNAESLLFPSQNSAGAFASVLKLSVGGYRSSSNDNTPLYLAGTEGFYWSSTVNGTNARFVFFGDSVIFDNITRGDGLSVRCIKD